MQAFLTEGTKWWVADMNKIEISILIWNKIVLIHNIFFFIEHKVPFFSQLNHKILHLFTNIGRSDSDLSKWGSGHNVEAQSTKPLYFEF